MRFMNRIFVMLPLIALFASCSEDSPQSPQLLETAGITAQAPYLTKDHKGNAVLCWTEQGADSLNRLQYAVYDKVHEQFGPALTVPVSAGCSASAESVAKVAFKDDGTILAVFAKRFEQEMNPFAGAIYYSQSMDAGKSWTSAQFLHSDTAHAYGRGFFDLARLKDGEVGAVWLDGRFGKSIKGSALFFSRSTKGKGFGADACLDKGTCECCRTDLLTDASGNLHLAYRSILFPEPLSGKQVRDMVYKRSNDNGQSFSDAKLISDDNWEIAGCPHSGPSLAVAGNTTKAVWFTAAGGNSGLYSSSVSAGIGKFAKRELVSKAGRHPQMLALPDGKTAMVYEELEDTPVGHAHDSHRASPAKATPERGAHAKMMSHGPAAAAKIVFRLLQNGKPPKIIEISDGHHLDSHAVLTMLDEGVLVTWVRETENGSKIYYSKVKI